MARVIPTESILSIQAVKIILDALTSIDRPTDIDSVALRTGHSVYQIRHVLSSPQYTEMMADVARDKVAPLLVRNLRHIEKMVDDPGTAPSLRLNVNRELRQTWEALNNHSPVQNKDERAAQALSVLDSIRARKALVSVTKPVTCDPTEPSSSSSKPPSEPPTTGS